jgi:glycerophosphoryl diester phosphodiesterase
MLKIGHRGMPVLHLENTLPSFEAAFAHGADAIEYDVRACADGLVVIHDADLKRTHKLDKQVADMHLQQLSALHIPSVEEVIALCAPRGHLFLEIKEAAVSMPLVALLRTLPEHVLQRITVISFDASWLLPFHNVARTGLNMEAMQQAAADFGLWSVSYHLIEPSLFAFDKQVMCWTVNDTAILPRLRSFPLYGIMSDDVRILQ